MNDEYSELNDIILNRHDKSGTRKKMLIGIGTLAIIAIVIVFVMGRMSGSAPSQLPQPMPPVAQPAEPVNEVQPEPAAPAAEPTQAVQETDDEDQNAEESAVKQAPVPLAQSEVTVIDETTEEPAAEPIQQAETKQPVRESVAKPATVQKKTATHTTPKPIASGTIYIQIGSFSHYKPSRTFLANVERSGYSYTFDRVVVNGQIVNKVLVGPFKNRDDAVAHLPDIRRKIESGAFIYTKK